jgi:hypothetical protein
LQALVFALRHDLVEMPKEQSRRSEKIPSM